MTRPHKFGAVRTEVDGISFASKAEARRHGELKLMERAGQITLLSRHSRYPLTVAPTNASEPVKIGDYEDDFSYRDVRLHCTVIEDVKGFATPLYLWKKKHFEAQYGIKITEIKYGRAR